MPSALAVLRLMLRWKRCRKAKGQDHVHIARHKGIRPSRLWRVAPFHSLQILAVIGDKVAQSSVREGVG
jgi:hypothetical protein